MAPFMEMQPLRVQTVGTVHDPDHAAMSTTHRQTLSWEARSSHRRRALLGAQLATVTGERRANILNLSTGGALLDAAEPPVAGEPVTLIRDAHAMPGRIGWVNGHRFGMTFDHAISDAVVSAVTGQAGGADQVRS